MLTNPLTPPPHDDSVEFSHNDDSSIGAAPAHSVFATPSSYMGVEDEMLDEIYHSAEDLVEDGDQEMSDEDMSDGGAALPMAIFNQELSQQFADYDAEMAAVNLHGLSQTTPFPSTLVDSPFHFTEPFPPPQDIDTPLDYLEEIHGVGSDEGEVLQHSPQPAAMTSVAEQLQHLQNAQEHFNIVTLPAETHNFANNMEDRFNLSLGDFLYNWGSGFGPQNAGEPRRRIKGPSLTELHAQRFMDDLPPVKRKDLQGDSCDIQRMDWKKLGVTRLEARQVRRQSYRNYTNLRPAPQWHSRLHGANLKNDRDYFRFRQMDFDHDIHLSHFQLRNLISCASRSHVFYAGRSKIIQCNPSGGRQAPKRVAMNLTNPIVQPLHSMIGGIQISTLTVEHNILVAGGFCGEYALVNLRAHKDTKHTEGIVTNHENSITNHVQVHLSRTSHTPQVAIASNDNGMRILDVATNKFVADHGYDHAINCTAISPDQRLRVLVGDSRQVMICHADTGEVLQSLEGHRDFGFACDWADDGWTVATGNQDMQVKIWDARKWANSQGVACPVTTIAAEMAGVRKLKFSPLGSGKRVLVAAEPADIINVIDAETFQHKQTLSFFGEIGGFDFTNGGRDLMVANCDTMRGGLMEFERCDLGRGSVYEIEDLLEGAPQTRMRRPGMGYDWRLTDEDVTEDPASWGTLEGRRRNTTLLGSQMGHF